MIEVINRIEYTYVRVRPKEEVIRGAVAIGNDIVYPPLGKPLPKEEYAKRGVDFVSKMKDGDKNVDYYNDMMKAYEQSKGWHRVVSVDENKGISNRNTIAFYKKNAGLEEKDAKEVKEYYDKKDKK